MAVKLADIAEACGVDISTVSRAMRDDPRVLEETRQRIQAIARKMDYRPNLLARSLAAGRTNCVAIIVHGLNPGTDNMLFDAASYALQQRGYMSMIMPHRGDMQQYERMVDQLGQGLVDGVLVIAGDPQTERSALQRLQQSLPVVFLDRGLEHCNAPLVTAQHAAAIEHLIAECRARGVQTWCIGFGEHNTAARTRSAAARKLLRGASCLSLEGLDAQALQSDSGPIAVLVSTQQHAQSAMKRMAETLRERRCYVACFDAWHGDCVPAREAFIAVQDFDAMAEKAVETCIALIDSTTGPAVGEIAIPVKRFEHIRSEFC